MSRRPLGDAGEGPRLETIAGYQVIEWLCVTGNGRLCRAKRTLDLAPVILKLPNPAGMTPAQVTAFRHEYDLLSQLNVPGVARPVAWIAAREPAMVLEDFRGESLATVLSRGRLGMKPALQLARDLARILAGLHAAHLVHRDLRPANFLVDLNGSTLRLVDCSRACYEADAHLTVTPPVEPEAWAYLAPEQTGQLQRVIDERSDLYAAGVMMYQLFTGELPFSASDPLEWAHCHVALEPRSPIELDPVFPPALAAVVLRLLAKQADDRYQSARGLERDLEHCLLQWEEHQAIAPFPLGRSDATERFQLLRRFYGRTTELATLMDIFERMATTGVPSWALVTGPAGIGKTSLVQEAHRRVARRHGYFAAGKFEQYRGELPYASIAQAFRDLIRQLLGEATEQIEAWRNRFQEALGPSGRLITDIVPQLELIIGPQPELPPLPPIEARHRFHYVFRQFVEVVASSEHPLVMFLDDLQWADAGTLALIEDLLTFPETHYVLFIGSYREQLVHGSHPLVETIAAVKAVLQPLQIHLGPLDDTSLQQLVADTLRAEPMSIAGLAALVQRQTEGNPFFVMQFLRALQHDGLINFDMQQGCWRWSTARIESAHVADDVVELLVDTIRGLTPAARAVLAVASCIGSQFDTGTLAAVAGSTLESIAGELQPAVDLGLLLPLGRPGPTHERAPAPPATGPRDEYRWLHDRVQQAAYSLIPQAELPVLHLQIGRALMNRAQIAEGGATLFEVVSHLNAGAGLIEDEAESVQLAELNRAAGEQAAAANAYASAVSYYSTGMTLLPAGSWDEQYTLTFDLYRGRAECAYLSGDFAATEQYSQQALQHARDNADRVRLYMLKIDLYTTSGQEANALAAGVECLHELGIDFPAAPSAERVAAEERLVWTLLGDKPIESLLDLPPIESVDVSAALDILAVMHPPAHFADQRLYEIIPSFMTTLTQRFGTAPSSAIGYAMFGAVIGHLRGRYQEAYRFGKLACNLIDRVPNPSFRARVYLPMGHFINPYARSFASSVPYLDQCFKSAMQAGNLTFSCYALFARLSLVLMNGDHLDDVYQHAVRCLDFTRQARFGLITDGSAGLERLVQDLRGNTARPGSFSGPLFDEDAVMARMRGGAAFSCCYYLLRRLQSHYLYGDFAAALALLDEATPYLHVVTAELASAEYCFYGALTLAAAYEEAPVRQSEIKERLSAHQARLRACTDSASGNFENQLDLVSAEVARIEGRDLEAMRLFDAAIRSARDNGFVQQEAIAGEVAARFYARRGFVDIAELLLRQSRACYGRWGANGKVRQLDTLYPQLATDPVPPSALSQAESQQLDVLALVKSLQAISGQIDIDHLLDTLMRVLMESAGAQKGYLWFAHVDGAALVAETRGGRQGLHVRRVLQAAEAPVPASVLNYVRRSREVVMLSDATAPNPFSEDAYLAQRKPKSLLCLPILHQAELVGLLYLENNLSTQSFTPQRLTVIGLLAAQAGVSLENARLYAAVRASEAHLRAVLQSAPILLFGVDGRGRFTLVAGGNSTLLGVQAEELADRPIADAFSHRADLLSHYYRAAGGEAHTATIESGSASVEMHWTPQRAANGSIAGVICVAVDVTDRVAAQRAAETLAGLRSDFVASVSHELRTPLTAIIGYGELLQARWVAFSEERKQEHLARILSSANRQKRLVDDLLLLGRMELGHMNTRMERVSVAPTIGRAADEVRNTYRGQIIDLAGPADLVALADGERMVQILANLLDNAAKYSEEGSRVSATWAREGNHVVVRVHDQGSGIPPSGQEILFTRFGRVPGSRTRAGRVGTGLGLFLSRQIAEAMGGTLNLEDTGPTGSTFCLRLPLASS